MPDFRVDDSAPEHPKLRAAGLAAVGLWTTSGAYAMRELTDGFVPSYYVRSWPSGTKLAGALVRVGLWSETKRSGVAGYQFHDWENYQRPAERFHEDRRSARERAAKSRRTRAARADDVRPRHTEVTQAPSPSPSPSSLRGDFGGAVPDVDARAGAQGPPAPNFDSSNPRCPRHRDVPAGDPGPDCRRCRDVRLEVEASQAAPDRDVDAELAIRACSWCDGAGRRIDPRNPHRGPLVRGAKCDHTPWSDEQLEAAS